MGSFTGSHHNYILSGRRRQRRSRAERALHILDRSQYHSIVLRGSDGLLISITCHTKGTGGAIDLSQSTDNVSPDPR